MALKDHILKLADGVSKCQENAKSLAQVIFRGLDDIADNLPEHPGGGSDVSVTQVLSSGTKTATITVDDTPTDLYAPDPTDVDVTQVQTSGTKIATVTVDDVPTDIYAPTPSAPTDVDVTQVLTSGTKIATISVDNVPTDIYAPSASGHIYSTSEQVVGKWIDGTTDVYERTFYNNNLTLVDNAYYVVSNAMTVSDFAEIVEVSGGVKTMDGGYFGSLFGIQNITAWQYGFHINNNGILLYGTGSQIAGGTAIVKLRYIKPTS